jgi:hypothetical protein
LPDRKPSKPKYIPAKASAILAEDELLGSESACSKGQSTRQTLHNYKSRLCEDDELLQLFTLKKRVLAVD